MPTITNDLSQQHGLPHTATVGIQQYFHFFSWRGPPTAAQSAPTPRCARISVSLVTTVGCTRRPDAQSGTVSLHHYTISPYCCKYNHNHNTRGSQHLTTTLAHDHTAVLALNHIFVPQKKVLLGFSTKPYGPFKTTSKTFARYSSTFIRSIEQKKMWWVSYHINSIQHGPLTLAYTTCASDLIRFILWTIAIKDRRTAATTIKRAKNIGVAYSRGMIWNMGVGWGVTCLHMSRWKELIMACVNCC